MVYGWGKDSQQWSLGDGNTLVCVYSYFSLMFIFRLGYKKRWMLQGNDRRLDAQVTRDELEQRYGSDVPKLGLWSQYGLPIAVAVLIVVATVVSAF